MKLRLAYGLLALPALLAAYDYDYNPKPGALNLGSWDSATFAKNGTVVFGSPGSGQTNSMLGTGTSAGGSLIELNAKSAMYTSAAYEISTQLRIQTSGGNFVQYIRSTQGALNTSVASGPFFTVELNNPQFTATGCMGTLSFWQSDGTNATLKAQSQVPCYDHMIIRTVVFPVGGSSDYVWTMINGIIYSAYCDIKVGSPGIGLFGTPAVNGIERVQIGARSLLAPPVIDRTTIGTSSFPDRVDIHWTDPVDPNGVSVFIHGISRDGVYKDSGFNENDYTDNTNVLASQTYSYQIVSTSFHGITSAPVTFTVNTPAPGAVDPRRVGVRPTGSYWGAMGENIDNLSGNLNFTVPLLQTNARGGWGVPINLIYNSQMWRKDNGGTWLMGQDVGYGMGWRLMAGSVTPSFDNQTYVVDHWTFTDSTGAEYRLDVNTGGVWTSKEGVYVSFDANTNKLWFNNGTFWYMGCISGGDEQDAGTRYPTIIQDKNGNQIRFYYDAGLGTNYYDSSARIFHIVDVRGGGPYTYDFQYNFISRTDGGTDVIPHLTVIRSNVQTGETYYFYRASGVVFTSPWGDNYGSNDILQQVTGAANPNNSTDQNSPNRTYAFQYDPASELTKITLPPGGYLRYNYSSRQFSSNRNQVEVTDRYLVQDAPGQATGAEARYQITHEATTGTVHSTTNLVDPTNAAKVWTFTDTSPNKWQIGLLANFQKKSTLAGTALESSTVTWALSPTSNNPFVQTLQSTADGTQTQKTQVAVDQYGNVTDQTLFDYGASSATRKYQYTYLHNQNGTYANYYIRNSLQSKTVLDGTGGNSQSLGYIVYDNATCTAWTYPPPVGQSYANAPLWDSTNRTAFLGNANSVSTPGKGISCSFYDDAGNVYAAEGPGRPQAQISYTGGSLATPAQVTVGNDTSSLTSFTYTPWLGVAGYTGPNGVTGTYQYDDYAQPRVVQLATGGQITIAQYPGVTTVGGQAVATYPASFFPNTNGRYPWAQLSYTNGAAPQQFTRTTLDGLGRTIKVERGPTGANSVGSAVSVVDTEYAPCACSPVGKVKRVSQPYAPGATVYWTTYTYDGEGRTLTVTGPDGASQTKMTYNAQATGVSVAPPSTGSSVTAVDPKGNWKIVTSDVFGNTIQVTEPNPANAAQPLKTYYQYDKVDHLTLVSMPRNGDTSTACPTGNSTSTCQSRYFVYDATTLKLTSERHPETGTTTYQYQPGSHSEMLLLNKTDAKGQTTKIDLTAYDKYNRVTTVKFLDSSATEDPCQRTVYSYDTYPSGAGTGLGGGWGRLTTSQVGPSDNTASCAAKTDATGRWNQSFLQAYGYTGAGQVNLKRLIFSQIRTDASGTAATPTSTTWNTSYGYDDGGYQTSVTYPMGQTHLTALDFMRRPNTLTFMRPGFNTPGPTISGVSYNAADQMTSMTWPANPGSTVDPDAYTYPAFTETRSYNSFNQVAQIQTQVGGAASIVDLNYVYGSAGQNNGQVTSVASGLDTNFNSVYSYDSLNRLTGVSGTKNQTYGYDGWGNLTSKSGDGKVFNLYGDPYTNRLAGSTICYDPNGNLISITTACNNPEYGYDIQNRLVGVVVTRSGSTDISGHLDQSAERYYYTADNKRVSTARPNGNPGQAQVFYVYGAKGEIAATCTSYVFGDAPTCDGREPRDVKFAGRTVIQNFVPVAVDRLGSVVANPTQGSVGSTAAKYYAPFGEQYNEAVSGTVFPGNTNFATYFHEETTGLNYADQRIYTSQYGRFMTADPVPHGSFAASNTWNQYSYGAGDPVNNNDPDGLCTVAVAGITQSPAMGPFTNTVTELGADSAYPFAGQGFTASIGAVVGNDAEAARTALASLRYALDSNTGSIDVIAYSGGASAFTNAYGMLSSGDQARIGIILYVSPGTNGLIASNATTFAVIGTGRLDVGAGLLTQFPLGLSPYKTSCDHQDFACLVLDSAAAGVLARLKEKGDCNNRQTFLRNGKGGINGSGLPGGGGPGGPGGIWYPPPGPPEDLPEVFRRWEWVSPAARVYRM